MNIKEIISPILNRNKIILNLIIIILINIVGMTLYFRIDLTKNNSYSLSKISKEVVSNLESPLNIKIFFTKDLPAPYNSVYRYLQDLMVEYSESGNEYFNYEFIDVEKNKDMASEFGINSIQVREIKADQLKFRNAYMGLSIVHGDLIEKMPSITDAKGLEYKLSTMIKRMTGKIDTLLKLDSPIKVILYADKNLPISGVEGLEKKVSDIVKKCSTENYDKVEFKYVESAKDKSALDSADIYGIVKLEWPSHRTIEGKTIKSGKGLLGIVVELEDKFESINILSRSLFGQYMVSNLENLQDSLNKAIENIININPSIGYIIGHNERDIKDNNAGAGNLKSLLSDMYDVTEVNLAEGDIPEDINAIIVNGPKSEYSDYELLKIDQFIMKGKSVLFMIDSFQEIKNQQANMFGGGRPMVLPLNIGIEKLLSHYGVTVNKDIVLDKKCYKSAQKGFGGQDIYFVPIIQKAGLFDENVITGFLKMIVWPKASSVSILEDKVKEMGVNNSILVSSSENSWLMQGRISFMPFGMSPPTDKSQMKKRNLAVLLEGKYESYFKGKEVPEEEIKDEKGKKKKAKKKAKKNKKSLVTSSKIIKKAVKPAKIMVIGTSEITLPGVIDKGGNSLNAVFLHNALDYLSGNYNIQEMRSKGLEFNPLEDTDETVRLIFKLLNIAGLPILVIGFGLIVWRRRSSRKKRIMKEFAK